jgi:hypothetical protein
MRRFFAPAPDDHLGQEDDSVRAAIRWALWFAVAGVGFLVVAALWVSTCGAAEDTVACGRPERTLLGLGAPIILLIGGIGAFVRTYRVWRAEGTWWGWQGAGWFLMTLMLLTLTMGFPVLAGHFPAGSASLVDVGIRHD